MAYRHYCILTIGILLLSACSGSMERAPLGDRHLPLRTAVEHPEEVRGQRVEWGGVVVDSRNLREHSELEILAYPLSGSGRPDLEARPRGRFVALQKGYLESVEYAAGRLVTVSGPLAGLRRGSVGESRQDFPLVEISNITLWEHRQPATTRPRIHFGISGGNRGTGVGVGIGF